MEAGIELKDWTQLRSALANFPTLLDPEAVRALLSLNANPNPAGGKYPALGQAAFAGQLGTVRLLIEGGAGPDAKARQDVTPLMMAAAAPLPNTALVRLLIEKGADLHARDMSGRTALDWALMQGGTEVARLLRSSGATASVAPASPPPRVKTPRPVRTSIAEAVTRLQPISRTFYEHAKCASCHNQFLPAIAMKLAGAEGIAVDADAAAHPARATLEVWRAQRENLMLGRLSGGESNELAYGLLALSETGVAPGPVTDAAVTGLLSSQRADGSWVLLDTRPPQADNSPIAFTAMAVRGLDVYGLPGMRELLQPRIARARQFLRAATPASTQDEAFKLLGLVWSRASNGEISAQAKRLLALQRQDGGWAQALTMAPDAYATGQALYALHASGMSSKSSVYQNGVAYLLRTQLEDGTWFVRSRAFGFQPYFESGFAHGVDQFISASATAWAVMALAYTLE